MLRRSSNAGRSVQMRVSPVPMVQAPVSRIPHLDGQAGRRQRWYEAR